jgi:hypothetical protein
LSLANTFFLTSSEEALRVFTWIWLALLKMIKTGRKYLTRTNTLAYFQRSGSAKKVFQRLKPVANVIKLFTAVSYNLQNKLDHLSLANLLA